MSEGSLHQNHEFLGTPWFPQMVQEVLLDVTGFLAEVVQRVLQEILEVEMTEHVGAAPYERAAGRKGHRNSRHGGSQGSQKVVRVKFEPST
jgi:transposase-like protein